MWGFCQEKRGRLKPLLNLTRKYYTCNTYCDAPPVACVPNALPTAVPIPVPCGVCIALSYLIDNATVTGSFVLYANVL